MSAIILRLNIFFRIMETDDEEDNNMNLVMELEEATEIEDEVQIPVEAINLDEALCSRLVKLISPKVSVSRTCVEPTRTEKMKLLKKMDSKRLKEKRTNKNDHCTH